MTSILGREWDENEDKTLRDLWPTHTNAQIAERLNRSMVAVEVRGRRKLGLYRVGPGQPFNAWKPEQDELLRQLWPRPEVRVPEIARQLGRTRNAIIGRAHRLQLPMRDRSKTYNTEGVEQKQKAAKRKRRGTSYSPFAPKHSLPPTLIPDDPGLTGKGVAFMDAGYGQCRAPLPSRDKDGLTMFCGEPRSPYTKYCFCEYHRQRFTQPR